MKNRQNLLSIIALLFIISGAAGLIYQIVWFKYLSLFLGNTTYAQTIVLASFMGGLAIGAAWWGKKADRTNNPLSLYAWLELGIGVYCLAYPWLIELVKSLFISIVQSAGWQSDSGMVLVLKLVTSLATLLIPTILMGGTLPVLVRFISHRIEDSGKNVAILYFLNSFGAVGGSLLGGFFFIPLLGLKVTIFSGVVINILVGITALILARLKTEGIEPSPVQESETPQTFSDTQIRIAVLVAGLSGFAAMVYEVAWVRLLMPLLGSMTYSFTLMLVAFISGITLGSWIVSLTISRIKNLFGFLGVCQLGVVISMAVALPLYGRIPYYLWNLGSILSRTASAYPFFLGLEFLLCFVIMFIPTIFLGMSLPIATCIASRRIEMLGTSVGNIFSVNTLGTVLGSLTAGLVLIPVVGIRHALETAVVINLVLGLYVLSVDTTMLQVRKKVLSGFAVGVFFLYAVFSTSWNQHVMLMSIFRQIAYTVAPPKSYAEFLEQAMGREILYYEEGSSATVAVAKTPSTSNISLYVNGKTDASSGLDLTTQVLLGHYPMLFQRQVDDVMVVGLGSGVTVGSILTHPVSAVDCVEISPEVVEASHYFQAVNNNPLNDSRVRLVVDDALAFLKLTERSYDVIISEPSNPWVAGVGNLFTKEFFLQCRERLKPNGLMVQWFQTYEMSDETFQLVIRTLREVFPHVTLWQALGNDMVLLASSEPFLIDYDLVQEKIALPAVKRDLERVLIPDAMTLFSMQVLSEKSVDLYLTTGEINTEDLPLLEYQAPRDLFYQHKTERLTKLDERVNFADTTNYFIRAVRQRGLTNREKLSIGKLHSQGNRGNASLARQMLLDLHQQEPKDIPTLGYLVQTLSQLGRDAESLTYLERMVSVAPNDPQVLSTYAWRKFLYRYKVATSIEPFDLSEQERLLNRCVELTADTVDRYHVRLGEMYYYVRRYEEAIAQFRQVLKLREQYTPDPELADDQLRLRLSQSYWALRDTSKAVQFGVQATMINPRNEFAREHIYQVWSTITQ